MSVVPVDRELEVILEAARQGAGAGSSVAHGATGKPSVIAKINYSHEAMIDLIIANPGISQNMLAQHFGYTPSWISQVISSDTFQAALAKRREQVIDPVLKSSIEGDFKALAVRSLDVLQQKLNRPALEIPDNLALRTLEIASRAAGYGVKDSAPTQPTTPVEVNIHLEQLGGGLVALLQRKKREAQLIDAQPARGANTSIAHMHADGLNGEAAPMPDSSPAQAASLIAQLTDDSQSQED